MLKNLAINYLNKFFLFVYLFNNLLEYLNVGMFTLLWLSIFAPNKSLANLGRCRT